tara:strand:+ start:3235 stop:5136 length:1902 start_codon:yes stop_codon:yes gene_type:complete
MSRQTEVAQLPSLMGFSHKTRQNVRVTPDSLFGDSRWDFNSLESNPAKKDCANVIRWNGKFCDERFDAPQFASLNIATRECVYATMKEKTYTPTTIINGFNQLKAFLRWVADHGYDRLSDIPETVLQKYVIEVNRSGLHPVTRTNKLDALGRLWRYRDEMTDSISVDVLRGRSGFKVSGATRDEIKQNKYKFIPDEVARDLIRKAVALIRNEGASIVKLNAEREAATLKVRMQGKSNSTVERARAKVLADSEYSVKELSQKVRLLLSSCYTVLAFFTGLRISEMLSFKQGRIERNEKAGENWIYGRHYKIKKEAKKWMAPDICFEAHELAKQLTTPQRESLDWEISLREQALKAPDSGIDVKTERKRIAELKELRNDLFLVWTSGRSNQKKCCFSPEVSGAKVIGDTYLKELVRELKVFGPDGSEWSLHSHQFRRTFARFMAANMMNLRYLKEHFGHKSLDMTAWYDQDDIELTEMVLEYLHEFKKEKITAMLSGKPLAGAGAKHIEDERDVFFAGLTNQKAKDVFVEELADDVVLRSTGHSWCLGNVDNGDCAGTVCCMFDPSNVNECESAVVTDGYLPIWQEIERTNVEAMNEPSLGRFKKEAIERLLNETIRPIIARLKSDPASEMRGAS